MEADEGKGRSDVDGRRRAPLLVSHPSLSFLGPPVVLALFVVLAGVLLLAVKQKEHPALPLAGTEAGREQALASRGAPPSTSASSVVPAGAVAAAEQVEPGVELRVEAIEETWISISADDGGRVGMLLKPGDERQWRALKGFTLTVGNAGGIRVFLDGSEVPRLGSSGQVLRNFDLPAGWRKD